MAQVESSSSSSSSTSSNNALDDQSSTLVSNNNNNNELADRVKQEPDCDETTSAESNNATNNNNNNNNNTSSNYNNTSNDMSNESASEDADKTNLIVNYLPQNMTDAEFEDLFKKFGTMKSCKIVRNRVSGYSYGFGFVDFQTHKQAIQAIEELNGHELETKKIKVAFARPAGQDIKQANLYIKNVPNDWTQDDVKKVFEPYGNIIQVRVLGNNRGVAFVLYDLRKQAEDALEALNGKTYQGCSVPFEIKFAADKKVDKGGGGGGGSSSSSSNAVGGIAAGTGGGTGGGEGNKSGQKRERGNRGGRNRNRDRDNQRQGGGRQPGQRSFFDRQNNSNYDDRHQQQQQNIRGPGPNQYNAMAYGGGVQYPTNFNNLNGVGPVRQVPANRMNRYAPFLPVQTTMQPAPLPPTNNAIAPQMAPQMAPNPAYNFAAAQQQMIPFAMMPAQQMAPPLQPVNQTGQIVQSPMPMYGTAQMSLGYAPITQNTLSNIYSVASNNMNNAANMQPQIGQPMTMRNNSNLNSGINDSHDDGVTLFVYNIGPDVDENELRTMFAPYGLVTKCNVVRKTPGGETKGFGFVTFRDTSQADSAIAGLNGSMRNGRALQVSLKK